MDSGFTATDDISPLDVSGGGKIFLIRLPKDGRKFSIKTENDGDKIIDQISRDSKLFNIRLEQDVRFSYCNTLRPVIKNSLAETSCLGPEFAGILSVEQSFSQLIPVITTDVPITAYRKLNQVSGLRVRSMPRGSTSTLADLGQRISNAKERGRSNGGEGSSKKRRRIENIKDSPDKTIFIKEEIVKEETELSGKKLQKEKKEKKEKKEMKEHKEDKERSNGKKEKKHKKESQ